MVTIPFSAGEDALAQQRGQGRRPAAPGAVPDAGKSHVTAAWAQIRAGAPIARLRTDALDSAAEEVAPALAIAPEFRIATVTGWLEDLRRRLAAYRYAGSPLAASLYDQIRQFTAEAVTQYPEGTPR